MGQLFAMLMLAKLYDLLFSYNITYKALYNLA